MSGLKIVLVLAAIAYIALGVCMVRMCLFWNYLDALPLNKATKKVSYNINFEKAKYGGDIQHYANQTVLLNFPGQAISQKVCIATKHFSKDLELCFWIVKQELLVSDPYYPKLMPVCQQKTSCLFKRPVPVGIQPWFYPQSGLATTLISQKIDSKLALYNSSELSEVYYKSRGRNRLWIRSFFWHYEGIYTLSSRPFIEFNFTFQWPSLLPSGRPKFIYADCRETEIYYGTCSDDAFLINQ
ncbi:hypothetical protein DSO57_1004348 [Entomophthora muscae]|uniref:Uncharacterized protein n=1 Tax=Entomophthora muscae TaxID=34485 RepID=A0ACC2T848_9FUNG|nr:hypothetical protein DSO57_1004348 [Entomophthora muscae]